MISYGQYIAFNTLERKEIYDFLGDKNTEYFSNKSNYKNDITNLVDYKDKHLYKYIDRDNKRTYQNIYAYTFEVLIDKSLPQNNFHDFVKKFIVSFDVRYKQLLYVYKFVKNGNSDYVHILLFTRKTMNKKVLLRHTSDYYQNVETKRRCSKNHPNAKLMHKKNDPILDDNGNKQFIQMYVKNKEEKIFKYTDFKHFIAGIKKEIIYTLQHFTRKINFKRTVSKITVKEKDSILLKQKKFIKNRMICRINASLCEVQEALYLGYMDTDDMIKKFNKLIYKINKLIVSKEINYDGILVNLSYKQNFINYKNNHIDLENNIDSLINDYTREFYQFL